MLETSANIDTSFISFKSEREPVWNGICSFSLMAVFRWYLQISLWQLWFMGSDCMRGLITFLWYPDISYLFLSFFVFLNSNLVTVLGAAVLLNKETVKILQMPLRRIMGGNPRYQKYILGHVHTSRLLKLLESSGGQRTQGSQWRFFPAEITLVSTPK